LLRREKVKDGLVAPGTDLRVKEEVHGSLVEVLRDAVIYFLLDLAKGAPGMNALHFQMR
jgi:hypothetical protein